MCKKFGYVVLLFSILLSIVSTSAAPQEPGNEDLHVIGVINSNHIHVADIEPNADVTFQIFKSGNPEAVFEATMPSFGGTSYFLADFQHGIDLEVGDRIVVTDESVPKTKELTLVDFSVTAFDVGTTIVSGTAPQGAGIEGRVEDEVVGEIYFTATADDGTWSKDLSEEDENFIIGEQTNLEVWTGAGDIDGDKTGFELIYYPVYFTANYGTDIVNAELAPDSWVNLEVFEDNSQTNRLFGPESWPVPADGYIYYPLWQFGFDLLPGMFVRFEDAASGSVKTLTVDVFTGTHDIDGNRLHGIATPGKEIFLEIGRVDEPSIYTSIPADRDTWEWEYDLGSYQITGWDGQIRDDDGDMTKPDEGEEPPHATIRSYIHHDQVAPLQFVPDSTATIEVFPPGDLIHPIYTKQVQLNQWGKLDSYHDLNIDLMPDMVLSIEDTLYDGTPRVITMTLSNLSITDFDPGTNIVRGLAAPGTKGIRVFDFVDSGERQFFTVDADPDNGTWWANFDPNAEISRVQAAIDDNDGNSTSFYVNGDDFFQTVDSSGDILTATDEQGDETIVEIPPGAVEDAISLAYIPRESNEDQGGFAFIGEFDLNAYQDGVLLDNYVFQVPISMTLEYSDEDLVNIEEASLTLYTWDETTEGWIDAAQTCDPASAYQRFPNENYLVIEICHLGRFALLGEIQFIVLIPSVTR